ncbi:alcohol dehydrogenase catalytic domain-containing protein [Streptomyces sp. NPDC054813]
MRAVVLEEFGTPLVLRDIAKPEAGPGQVLVKVRASGVNPLDAKTRAGRAVHAERTLPAVLGLDLVGVVEDAGAGVDDLAPGDGVFGTTGGVGDLQARSPSTRRSTPGCSPVNRPAPALQPSVRRPRDRIAAAPRHAATRGKETWHNVRCTRRVEPLC